MQCKKALEEAGGDREKALIILKKKSSEVAAKKADREATSGVIVAKKSGTKGILLKLNCETDFVAKNSDFTALAETLANLALEKGVEVAKTEAIDLINPVIQKIGENIVLAEIVEIEGEVLGSYVHDGRIGVVVALSGGTPELAKDVAMHFSAMRPAYITKNEIPEENIAKARETFSEEVKASGKPEDIQEKMIEGKLATYFKEQTLMDQAFIKNPDVSIEKLLAGSKAQFIKLIEMTI